MEWPLPFPVRRKQVFEGESQSPVSLSHIHSVTGSTASSHCAQHGSHTNAWHVRLDVGVSLGLSFLQDAFLTFGLTLCVANDFMVVKYLLLGGQAT